MVAMGPARVRVSIYSTQIDRFFLPGGDGWRWTREVTREILFESIARAPSRTGVLKSMHGMSQTPAGKRGVRGTVHNDADHARYVALGTSGPITSSRPGGYLMIRPAPHSWFPREVPLRQVRGQRANNWMGDAMSSVMLRHGIIAVA